MLISILLFIEFTDLSKVSDIVLRVIEDFWCLSCLYWLFLMFMMFKLACRFLHFVVGWGILYKLCFFLIFILILSSLYALLTNPNISPPFEKDSVLRISLVCLGAMIDIAEESGFNCKSCVIYRTEAVI